MILFFFFYAAHLIEMIYCQSLSLFNFVYIVNKSNKSTRSFLILINLVKTKALANGIIKDSEEKIKPIEEPEVVLKHREFEQTQELLVGLTNELFDQVEKMSTPKKKPNGQKTSTPKEKPNGQKMSTSKEKSKIEFTDLSWYRKKLEDKNEKK